jgi:hypothetical protein
MVAGADDGTPDLRQPLAGQACYGEILRLPIIGLAGLDAEQAISAR